MSEEIKTQEIQGDATKNNQAQVGDRQDSLVEVAVNDLLLRNGWDYDDRKRVLFMLRNRKHRKRTLDECIEAVYQRYGTDLPAFFADAHRDAKSRAESRQLGGV